MVVQAARFVQPFVQPFCPKIYLQEPYLVVMKGGPTCTEAHQASFGTGKAGGRGEFIAIIGELAFVYYNRGGKV